VPLLRHAHVRSKSENPAYLQRAEVRLNRAANAWVYGGIILFVAVPVLTAIATDVWPRLNTESSNVVPCIYFSLLVVAWYMSNATRYRRTIITRRRQRIVIASSSEPAVLICRSFSTEGIAFKPARLLRNGPGHMVFRDSSYLDEVSQALAQFGHCIALGSPRRSRDRDQPVGADLLYVQTRDEDWECAFNMVALAARFIWIIPGLSAGLLKEMRTLRDSGLTAKTVVFMPPQPDQRIIDRLSAPYLDFDQFSGFWKRVGDHWQAEGCNLPKYESNGAVFTVNSDLSARRFVTLLGSLSHLSGALNELLPTLPPSRTPASEVFVNLQRVEAEPPPRRWFHNFSAPWVS
jgi:hypothetical protein